MSRLRHRGAGTLLSLFLIPALAASASAQVVVGGSAKPQIEVDMSVLDHLGSTPSLPGLFLGGPGAAAPGAEAPAFPESQVPVLRRPQRPIVLKKPSHKAAKPKAAVAAKPAHAKTAAAKPAVTAPATGSPKPAAAAQAPAPVASAQPKPDSVPAETRQAADAPPPPAGQPGLPAISLPVIVPQVSSPAAPDKSAAAEKPKPEAKPEKKAENKGTDGSRADQQPAPPEPVKLVPTPTPPIPEKAPPASTAQQAPAPAPIQTPTPPQQTQASPPDAGSQAPVVGAPMPPTREQQEARLPQVTVPAAPAPATAGNGTEAPMTILFEKDGARLPDEVRTSLNQLADRLAADGVLQLQLLAYAEGDEDNASKARRLSLSRALAVRSYLIDQGVRSTRIEVRALGNKVPEGPADRVDILVQKR